MVLRKAIFAVYTQGAWRGLNRSRNSWIPLRGPQPHSRHIRCRPMCAWCRRQGIHFSSQKQRSSEGQAQSHYWKLHPVHCHSELGQYLEIRQHDTCVPLQSCGRRHRPFFTQLFHTGPMVHSPVVGPTPELPLTPESEDDGDVSHMPGFHL